MTETSLLVLINMQKSLNKDRFMPLRKSDLIQSCIDHKGITEQDIEAFSKLCKLIVSTLHFEYHKSLEILKDSFAPFDAKADTLPVKQHTEASLQEESLFKVRLAVEFNDFAEVVFYRRGSYQKTEVISSLWGLKKEEISFTNYDKVAVYIKFKDADYFFAQQKRNTHHFEPGSTIIKLFQNVPKADLEMFFPNSEVRMRAIDKMIIGGSAVVGGAIMLITKLGASLI